jgi:hypothetical protein
MVTRNDKYGRILTLALKILLYLSGSRRERGELVEGAALGYITIFGGLNVLAR